MDIPQIQQEDHVFTLEWVQWSIQIILIALQLKSKAKISLDAWRAHNTPELKVRTAKLMFVMNSQLSKSTVNVKSVPQAWSQTQLRDSVRLEKSSQQSQLLPETSQDLMRQKILAHANSEKSKTKMENALNADLTLDLKTMEPNVDQMLVLPIKS